MTDENRQRPPEVSTSALLEAIDRRDTEAVECMLAADETLETDALLQGAERAVNRRQHELAVDLALRARERGDDSAVETVYAQCVGYANKPGLPALNKLLDADALSLAPRPGQNHLLHWLCGAGKTVTEARLCEKP